MEYIKDRHADTSPDSSPISTADRHQDWHGPAPVPRDPAGERQQEHREGVR